MNKFKVGDVVRSIEEPGWGKYVIIELDNGGYDCRSLPNGIDGYLPYNLVDRYNWVVDDQHIVDRILTKYSE